MNLIEQSIKNFETKYGSGIRVDLYEFYKLIKCQREIKLDAKILYEDFIREIADSEIDGYNQALKIINFVIKTGEKYFILDVPSGTFNPLMDLVQKNPLIRLNSDENNNEYLIYSRDIKENQP